MADDEVDIKPEDHLEDELTDWAALNRQFKDESLPKRGIKYFEQDGSNVQLSKLEQSRQQMYLALSGLRGHHEKSRLEAVWIPGRNMAIIIHPRGSFFKDIGYAQNFKHKPGLQALWLSPIEVVYLTERGSCMTYLGDASFDDFMKSDVLSFDITRLMQMSMAHLYGAAFSVDYRLHGQYQVYALLKRLGYLVRPHERRVIQTHDLPQQLALGAVVDWLGALGFSARKKLFDPCTRYLSYTQVYESLDLIPSTSSYECLDLPLVPGENYQITFDVWKPSPSFSKKNPPLPAYHVCVADISLVPHPTLRDIQSMWNQINFLLNCGYASESNGPKKSSNKTNVITKRERAIERRLARESKLDTRIVERNHMLQLRDTKLKEGSGRSIVIAAIDNGIINFTSHREAEFKLATASLVEDLNKFSKRERQGLVWTEKLVL